jgi:hypothetical protein
MAKKKRWVQDFHVAAGGLFNKDARTIARAMADKRVSPKGPQQEGFDHARE